jgi:hypothetical protein
MNTYAYATKVSEGSYEVFNMLHLDSPNADQLIQRIETALDSGLPITTMVTTDVPNAYTGAVWDGEAFVGGERPEQWPEEFDDTIGWGKYAFLVDNAIFLTSLLPKGGHVDLMTAAAFTQEVTIIKVPEGQQAARGSIWDGTTFTNPE